MLKNSCLSLSLFICAGLFQGTAASAAILYNDPEAIFTPESGDSPTLDGPINAALAGDKLALDQVYTYDKLLPSTSRISKPVIVDLIHRAHVKAKAVAKESKPLDAANILRQSLDLSHYMSSLARRRAPWDKAVPGCWLDSWKSAPVELQLADYIAPLNDYGFFLQKAGKDAQAVPIFRAVIAEDPTREVAYLNLADSLKQIGRTTEAGQYYRLYKQLMEHEQKAVLVPQRVDLNRKHALTTDVEVSTETVSYMDILNDTIRKQWHPPKSGSSAKIIAQFRVDENGHLKDIKLTKTSGDEALDRCTTDALASVVLPPPPTSIKPDDDIQFTFDYNAFNSYPKKVYPIDRWIVDVNESPTAQKVMPLVEALLLLHRFDDAKGEVDVALQRDSSNGQLEKAQTGITLAREAASHGEAADNASVQRILRQTALIMAGGTLPPEAKSRDARSQAEAYPEHRRRHADGMIDIMNGAWEQAIADLSSAALSFPSCKESITNLARAYNLRSIGRGGDNDKALHDLHCSYCIYPDPEAVAKNISARMKKIGMDPASFNGRAAYADRLNKNGDLVGAVVEYRIALTIQQDSSTLEKMAAIAAKLKAGSPINN
jgi:tetratricopeptide (TPR) repeat protein